MDRMYSVKEVAEKLNIRPATVYMKVNSGELNHYKLGKTVRISGEQLSDYLKSSINGACKIIGRRQ